VLEQQDVANRINAKLVDDAIKSVTEDVIAWKMHTLIRDGLVKRKKEKGKSGKLFVLQLNVSNR
jgi:hypothetical protein